MKMEAGERNNPNIVCTYKKMNKTQVKLKKRK
jgi:hypothetical protein